MSPCLVADRSSGRTAAGRRTRKELVGGGCRLDGARRGAGLCCTVPSGVSGPSSVLGLTEARHRRCGERGSLRRKEASRLQQVLADGAVRRVVTVAGDRCRREVRRTGPGVSRLLRKPLARRRSRLAPRDGQVVQMRDRDLEQERDETEQRARSTQPLVSSRPLVSPVAATHPSPNHTRAAGFIWPGCAGREALSRADRRCCCSRRQA
jgi:hypothetical protein